MISLQQVSVDFFEVFSTTTWWNWVACSKAAAAPARLLIFPSCIFRQSHKIYMIKIQMTYTAWQPG